MSTTRLALIAILLVPGVAWAQSAPSSLVLTTKHFAFHSDLGTNVHDALIDAGTARRAQQPELFAAGAEKACFDYVDGTRTMPQAAAETVRVLVTTAKAN